MGIENHVGYAQNAFLGKEAGNTNFVNSVNVVADKVDVILNPMNDAAKKKVNGDSIKLIQDLGIGVDHVSSLNDTLQDPNKTSTQKENANVALDLLAKGVYVAMRYGRNQEIRDALCGGSVVEVEDLLPEPLKGLGERVRANIIDEPQIIGILDNLDVQRKKYENGGSLGKKALAKKMEEAYQQLADLSVDSIYGDQQGMVMDFLGAETDKLDAGAFQSGNGLQGGSKVEEYLRQNAEYARASAEYAQRKGILEGEIEKVSLDELLDSYLKIKAPRERAPQIWEYEVPKFMNGMSREKWRKLLNFNDAWLGAIYNKRADAAYNNSLDKMKDGILSMKSLEEGDLKVWYEDRTLNLKGVMHHISRELLTPKQFTASVPVIDKNTGMVTFKNVTRTIYVFDTEIDPVSKKERYKKGSKVEEYVDNEDVYKTGLAKRLVEKKIVKNISVAKLAIAMSMDVMEMGGVFSVADGLRRLSWEADSVRLVQRPQQKYSLKVGGGELFAGPWTELANTLSQGDPKKAMELVKSWGVVPELLSGSFMDQSLYLENGKKTNHTIMEMVYNDEQIPFRDLGNDLLFGWRKDHIQPATRTWMYIANKIPLEFSKNRENDAVISQWRSDLFNDINQLRKNEDGLFPTSVIAGAIGGSVGLWPFEGPYLRVSGDSHKNAIIDYFEATTEIVRQLGLGKEEYDRILQFFGVDKKNYNDLNRKIVSYTEVRNVTLPGWYKEKSRKTLFTKRPQ